MSALPSLPPLPLLDGAGYELADVVLRGPFADHLCDRADAEIAQQKDDRLFPQRAPEVDEPDSPRVCEIRRLVRAGRIDEARSLAGSRRAA